MITTVRQPRAAVQGSDRVRAEMVKIPLEALCIADTPCGRVRLDLSARVRWKDFPGVAAKLMGLCGGAVRQKADTAEIRVWQVTVGDSELNLVFQDCPAMVFLESSDPTGDRALRELYGLLSPKE
jgi:hypothetical protein